MTSQKNFLFEHYRKLDIYSRVFILNYGDLSDLESNVVRLKGDDLVMGSLLSVTTENIKDGYLDLSDMRLVLASLSLKRLNAIFKVVLLELLSQDGRIKINAKLINLLKTQLIENELHKVLHSHHHISKNKIGELLLEYSVNDAINGLIAFYFQDLHKSLNKQIEKRFKLSNYSKMFKSHLNRVELDKIVYATISRVLPITSSILSNLRGHEKNS